MFERFTDRARKVMQLANQEAQRLNHDRINSGHVLVGLVKEGSGVAANVLKNLGADLIAVRKAVEDRWPAGTADPIAGRLPMAADVHDAVHQAVEAAAEWRHSYIGTEHLLFGLTRSGGPVVEALAAAGVTATAIEAELRLLLGDLIPSATTAAPPVPPFRVGSGWRLYYFVTDATGKVIVDDCDKDVAETITVQLNGGVAAGPTLTAEEVAETERMLAESIAHEKAGEVWVAYTGPGK